MKDKLTIKVKGMLLTCTRNQETMIPCVSSPTISKLERTKKTRYDKREEMGAREPCGGGLNSEVGARGSGAGGTPVGWLRAVR